MNPVQWWVVPSISMLLAAVVGCADPGPADDAVAVWHDGEAFALELELPHATHVVVLHVDARGRVALVHPESARGPIRPVGPGSVRIPPAGAGYDWVFEGEPGWESFIVGRSEPVPDIEALLRRLPDAAASAASDPGAPRGEDGGRLRQARVTTIARLVRDQLGTADVIEVLHLP